MDELTALPNIGKILAKNLRAINIHSANALYFAGAKNAFLLVRTINPDACLHQLYALAGAAEGVRYTLLEDETIADLRRFYKSLTQ